MEWIAILQNLLGISFLPTMLIILAAIFFLIRTIIKKTTTPKEGSSKWYASVYSSLLEEVTLEAVKTVNKIYVEALKAEGNFTEAEQEIARQMVLKTIKNVLSDNAIKHLKEISPDIDKLILKIIEECVEKIKKQGC